MTWIVIELDVNLAQLYIVPIRTVNRLCCLFSYGQPFSRLLEISDFRGCLRSSRKYSRVWTKNAETAESARQRVSRAGSPVRRIYPLV